MAIINLAIKHFSPAFIATMKAWTDVAGENVNTLPKYKDEDKSNTLIIQGEFNMGVEYSELDKKDKGTYS